MTLFIRAIDAVDKADYLRSAVKDGGAHSFQIDVAKFASLPGSPFAYWTTPKALECYSDLKPVSSSDLSPLSTNQLSDDSRYARLWWEPGPGGSEHWVVWAKGRSFAPFYYDIQTVVRWSRARGTYTGFIGTKDRPLEKPASADWFFRPGLTWPRRTNRLSFSVLPSGCIFGNKGPAIFEEQDNEERLLAHCAILNSKAFNYLLGLQLARVELAQSFEVGLVQAAPIPAVDQAGLTTLAELGRRLWSLRRRLDETIETSHAFKLPRALLSRVEPFDPALIQREIDEIQLNIEAVVYRLYGLTETDQLSIEAWGERLKGNAADAAIEVDNDEESGDEAADASDFDAVISWSVGVACGRFDVRLATGARRLPPPPSPFTELPPKSPAMLPDGDTPAIPVVDILVDDPGHENDLSERVVAVCAAVAYSAVDKTELRQHFARNFFDQHLRQYSKSRRKAPIYWQLATVSASYSVWIYTQSFTKDTLFRVQNEFVSPKLAHEKRQLESLRAEAGARPDSNQMKSIEAQEAFVSELQAFADELARISPLWFVNPDDGILVNFAPLWRLVSHNRAWQRELLATWRGLCDGKFDWSHLAMQLWPERVIPKCATDRSLAIAHGLESVFWFEDEQGEWKAHDKPKPPFPQLVRDRTSPSIKAALKSLTDAAEAGVGSKRTRKSKAV
ncbi:hypothetical protein [Bradyrhizobium yuanmingense]|uniref:hypothetical protein n=1 Tax=Bradyrhizobium yuanmingense TaxID=108015 RepID=UPI0006864BA0|nr:hypothetical protein [Bradyrhizobium yuanmingense]